MNKKLLNLMTIAVLTLTGIGQTAEWENWTGAVGDYDWNNAGNWENNRVPTAEEWALLAKEAGPIVGPGMVVNIARIDVGRNSKGHFIVDGGVINASNTVYICSGSAEGTLDLFSGVINIAGNSNMNWMGKSTLNMYGGTYTVGGNLNLSQGQASTDCTINLYAGIMDLGDLTKSEGGVASVNVRGGTMLLNGDHSQGIQGFIDANVLDAYNGQGTLHVDYDVSNIGKTTVTASHPFAPIPADGSLASPGNTTLQWTLPANVDKVDVWFSDDRDKILSADPSAFLVDQEKVNSANVTTAYKRRYYWAVDIYTDGASNPEYGLLFSFLTDHAPPEVTVGEDYDMFLKNGQRTGALTGSVTDDGAIEPYTVEWTIVQQPSDDDPDSIPSAVIVDPSAEQTTVTVFAAGIYIFRLTADDGEYTGSEEMTVNVFEDTWGE